MARPRDALASRARECGTTRARAKTGRLVEYVREHRVRESCPIAVLRASCREATDYRGSFGKAAREISSADVRGSGPERFTALIKTDLRSKPEAALDTLSTTRRVVAELVTSPSRREPKIFGSRNLSTSGFERSRQIRFDAEDGREPAAAAAAGLFCARERGGVLDSDVD